MFTLKCDIPGCNREFSHEKEVVLKRILGFHKAKIHHIPGAEHNRSGKFLCKYCGSKFKSLPGLGTHVRVAHASKKSEEQRAEERRAYQKKWRDDRNAAALTTEEKSHRSSLQKSAWWQVESGKPEPVKLDQCPCCGARFMAVKGSV